MVMLVFPTFLPVTFPDASTVAMVSSLIVNVNSAPFGIVVIDNVLFSSTYNVIDSFTLIWLVLRATLMITYSVDFTYLAVPANSTVMFATPSPTA